LSTGLVCAAAAALIYVLEPISPQILALLPRQTYSDGSVTLSYPVDWANLPMSSFSQQGAQCVAQDSQCLFAASSSGGNAMLLLMRDSNADDVKASFAQYDIGLATKFGQASDVKVLSHDLVKVDGRLASKLILSTTDSGVNNLLVALKEDSGTILV